MTALSTALSKGEPSATQSAVLPFPLYVEAYSFWGFTESHPIPPPSLYGGEGSSVPGLVPSNDLVNSESVLGMKSGDLVSC